MSYTTETIVIKNPSKKMMDMIEKLREHKKALRDQVMWNQCLPFMHEMYVDILKRYIADNYGK